MFYTIAYDISDDSRRNRVSEILEGYGQRVQKSVFECELSIEQLETLIERLTKAMNEDEDSLRCYALCERCLASVRVIGGQPLARDPQYYIV